MSDVYLLKDQRNKNNKADIFIGDPLTGGYGLFFDEKSDVYEVLPSRYRDRMIQVIETLNAHPEKVDEKATKFVDNLTEELIIEIEKLRAGEETSESLTAKANELISLFN